MLLPVCSVRPVLAQLGALGELGAAKKKKKAKGDQGSIFEPGGTPAQLWTRAPTKRKVDFAGMVGPEDTLIAVARGMHPGVLIDTEYRATIRGGLTALKMAGVKGYTKVKTDGLASRTVNGPKEDAALIKAAGGGKTLKAAAERIVKVVHKAGLDKAAWGARQLYVLENIKGFQIAHGVAVAAVNVIPGVGQIVSAAGAAHMAISAAIAKKISEEAGTNLSDGIKQYKAKAAKKAAAAEKKQLASVASSAKASETEMLTDAPVAVAPSNTKKYLLIGGALVGVVLIVVAATSGGKGDSTPRRAA